MNKSVTNMYGSTLLALRGGGWVSNFQKKHYVTLEWPLMHITPMFCLQRVTVSHFPLGSALLYKTGLGNQWALGLVLGSSRGLLQVGESMDKPHPKLFPADSEDLLPVCFSSDGMTIISGNGESHTFCFHYFMIGVYSPHSRIFQSEAATALSANE